MGITLSTPTESVREKNAPAPPLLPVDDGGPITAAGVTLAVCARASAPDDGRLCRKADGKVRDSDGNVVTDAGGKAQTETVWRQTSRVDDIARAFAGGLLSFGK